MTACLNSDPLGTKHVVLFSYLSFGGASTTSEVKEDVIRAIYGRRIWSYRKRACRIAIDLV